MFERVLGTFGHWYEVLLLEKEYESDKHVIANVMDDSIAWNIHLQILA